MKKKKEMSEKEMFLKAYERGNPKFWLNRTKPRKIIKESTHSWTAGNHPAHETIVVEGYERYWSNSTKTGHEIDIVRQDGSTISIKMKWPKGYNPRLYEVNHRGKG